MCAVLSQVPAADLAAVKTRQHAAWSTGNYAVVGSTLQIVGESLCEALDLRSGSGLAARCHKTYGALDAGKQADFTRDVLALIARDNRSGDGTMVLPAEYLEVVIERK